MPADRCPTCNSPTIPGAKYCDHCGFALFKAASAKPGFEKSEVILCQNCGHENLTVSKFCENCGAKLLEKPAIISQPAVPLCFRLKQSDQRIEFPINKTSFLIGRQDAENDLFPEIDLTSFGAQNFGIGRRHAQITIRDGEVFIEDLNSVNGTMVNRVKISTETPHLIKDGDEIRLGKLILIFCQSCE